jgi:uncharacterized SAM-binding protein YcdF (DUF218 family)
MSNWYKNYKTINTLRTSGKTYDVAIVPGGPISPEGMHPLLKERLDHAIRLFTAGKIKNIITSGAAVHSPYNEAEMMKNYLIEEGVPKEKILEEKLATTSVENLIKGYDLAKRHFENVVMATDENQIKVKKFKEIAKKHGMKIEYLPFWSDLE